MGFLAFLWALGWSMRAAKIPTKSKFMKPKNYYELRPDVVASPTATIHSDSPIKVPEGYQIEEYSYGFLIRNKVGEYLTWWIYDDGEGYIFARGKAFTKDARKRKASEERDSGYGWVIPQPTAEKAAIELINWLNEDERKKHWERIREERRQEQPKRIIQ